MRHTLREGGVVSVAGAEFVCHSVGTNGVSFVVNAEPGADVIHDLIGLRFQSVASLFEGEAATVYTMRNWDTQVLIELVDDGVVVVRTTILERAA